MVHVSEEITFLDYIKSGTAMHFAVAIDFTASNGSPFDSNSLHYLDPASYNVDVDNDTNRQQQQQKPMNPYEIALRAIGEIIQQYDSVGMFPAFGFGAKISAHSDNEKLSTQVVSHQFPLNGDEKNPYCQSMEDIIHHYRARLRSITLYGPTNFAPVIQNTSRIAAQFENGRHYFTLLIITDGIISDMYQTKNAIIDASSMPLSIIIVGVGCAEFDAMNELDSDESLLRCGDRVASRDIVQFVPLNRFLAPSSSYVQSQAELAKEVLAEIPDQMIGYMRSKGFIPGSVGCGI